MADVVLKKLDFQQVDCAKVMLRKEFLLQSLLLLL